MVSDVITDSDVNEQKRKEMFNVVLALEFKVRQLLRELSDAKIKKSGNTTKH